MLDWLLLSVFILLVMFELAQCLGKILGGKPFSFSDLYLAGMLLTLFLIFKLLLHDT